MQACRLHRSNSWTCHNCSARSDRTQSNKQSERAFIKFQQIQTRYNRCTKHARTHQFLHEDSISSMLSQHARDVQLLRRMMMVMTSLSDLLRRMRQRGTWRAPCQHRRCAGSRQRPSPSPAPPPAEAAPRRHATPPAPPPRRRCSSGSPPTARRLLVQELAAGGLSFLESCFGLDVYRVGQFHGRGARAQLADAMMNSMICLLQRLQPCLRPALSGH